MRCGAAAAGPAASPRPPGPPDEGDAEGDHGQREDLAHGRPADEIAQLDIRLTEILGDDAADAIADEEEAAFHAGPAQGVKTPDGDEEEDEEQNPLQPRLVELARMARQMVL